MQTRLSYFTKAKTKRSENVPTQIQQISGHFLCRVVLQRRLVAKSQQLNTPPHPPKKKLHMYAVTAIRTWTHNQMSKGREWYSKKSERDSDTVT